jgi:hypothetical protein
MKEISTSIFKVLGCIGLGRWRQKASAERLAFSVEMFFDPRRRIFLDGRLYILSAQNVVYLTQYCAGGKIETNEMDRACGAYGGE